MEPVEFIVNNFYKISGAILTLCVPAFFAYRHTVKVRLADKKQEFSDSVFAALGDLCNKSHYWDKNSFNILRNSISDIEIYATKLTANLGVFDSYTLHKAVNNYRKHTYYTWEDQAGWTFFQKNKWLHKSPKSKINKSISQLLKCAK
ncbi:hypothetical protein [Colwellia echini]|uniref:DUF4760 domain-containing protein n=1 Tax=Colwellia echini TaxID=1982103 RepID=A0ABY3MSW3_9GAMM|nr:hypothetical protein [Colwellia echini]TYK64292.1 hypothetical protein CWS31_016335 [Colwellia echini]